MSDDYKPQDEPPSTRLFLIVLFAAVLSTLFALSVSAAPAGDYTAFYDARWLGEEFANNPCAITDSAYGNGWHEQRVMPDTDGNYDALIIDWQERQVWQVFAHGDPTYALVWRSFARGDSNSVHPAAAHIVNCDMLWSAR